MRKVRIFSASRYLSIDLSEGRIKHVQKSESYDLGVQMLKQKKSNLEDITLGDFLKIEETQIEGEEPLFNELRAFCLSVQNGTPPAVTGEDGLKALSLAARIQQIVESPGAR
jgi:predicted dehydrogenase